MERFLLKISYDGTNYHGWQVQPNGITVQQVMCDAFKKMCSQKISVTGCSRTDAGVHANEFFCHFDTVTPLEVQAYINGLNAVLPKDIRVLGCIKVDGEFHARYSAKGKNYIYKFFDGKIQSPFLRNYALHVPHKINVEKVAEFCKIIVGTHDFAGFSSIKRSVTDTVRTVSDCHVWREGDTVILSITADGFLYNMVRIIAGTALEISREKIKIGDISDILSSLERSNAGPTLPPHGLYLNKVIY